MLSGYRFVLVHGAYGNPEENWFPWLRSRLEENGAEVEVPTLPTPEGQELERWIQAFDEQVAELDEWTVLIGHSIAVAFILRKLERIESEIKAAFLVSGFGEPLGLDEFDPINASFVEGDFDWRRIRSNCSRFFLYNSDNDPYVPLRLGREVADNLDANFTVVKNGGHINASAGFTKFPALFDDVCQYLSQST